MSRAKKEAKNNGLCIVCGAEIKLSRRRSFCGAECAKQGYKLNNAMNKKDFAAVKIRDTHVPREKYKSPISDAEQFKLNKELDAKHRTTMEERRYRPGDPGFAELAEYYTRIYSPEYRGPRTITADFDTSKTYGRREDTKGLR